MDTTTTALQHTVRVHGRTPFRTVIADVHGQVIEVSRTALDRAESEAAAFGVSAIDRVILDVHDLRIIHAAFVDESTHLCLDTATCRAFRRMP